MTHSFNDHVAVQQACTNFITEKMGDYAGHVTSVMLELIGRGNHGIASSTALGPSASRPVAHPIEFTRLHSALEAAANKAANNDTSICVYPSPSARPTPSVVLPPNLLKQGGLKELLSNTMCADPGHLFKRQENSFVIGMSTCVQWEHRSERERARERERITLTDEWSVGTIHELDMPNILNAYQRRTLDSIIENKFGSDALRVYRLLATKRKLEQKNISDFALIPMSRTKELLWAMFGGGLVIRQVCSNKHRSEQTALD
jgi:hypothetical protein